MNAKALIWGGLAVLLGVVIFLGVKGCASLPETAS